MFATPESLTWSVMMISMMAAGVVSQIYDAGTIGTWSGVLSSRTAFAWAALSLPGRFPEAKYLERRADSQMNSTHFGSDPA